MVIFGAQRVAVDVGITHPTAPSYVRTVSNRPCGAAVRMERAKHYSSDAACTARGYEFVPLIYETHGALGPEARRFFNRLVHFAEDASPLWSADEVRNALFSGTLMAVLRHNVHTVISAYQRSAAVHWRHSPPHRHPPAEPASPSASSVLGRRRHFPPGPPLEEGLPRSPGRRPRVDRPEAPLADDLD